MSIDERQSNEAESPVLLKDDYSEVDFCGIDKFLLPIPLANIIWWVINIKYGAKKGQIDM